MLTIILVAHQFVKELMSLMCLNHYSCLNSSLHHIQDHNPSVHSHEMVMCSQLDFLSLYQCPQIHH